MIRHQNHNKYIVWIVGAFIFASIIYLIYKGMPKH